MERESREQRLKFMRRQRDWLYRVVGAILAVILLGMALISLVRPDREFSEQENRMLTTAPSFTIAGIQSERLMKDLESYVADQFLLRDAWIRVKTTADLFLGKREFNGIYLGKDKYLMEKPSDPDREGVIRNMEAISTFCTANGNLRSNVMIVPNAAFVMKDYLPYGAVVRDQNADAEWLSGLLTGPAGYIDSYQTLYEHREEGLYYKTDHHWTTKGAMYAFLGAAEQMGIQNPSEQYEAHTVSNSFRGTLASNSGCRFTSDNIDVYAPADKEVNFYVTDSDNQEKRISLYNMEALDLKDQYQVFLGGNHALVEICTDSMENRVLLMFKDSYANCFVPFLVPYFSKIIMIDPRYYYDDVQRVIENDKVTDILFLYNMDTFMSDNSLADVLISELE